jgi:lipopolysaccharide/colanic/teichoic acid biosynthesis glycosyltransferase
VPKKIIVTEAGGFVGRQIVPRLVKAGCQLLLVGSTPSALTTLFPGIPSCSYGEIAEYGQGFDSVLHFSVLNNDASSSEADFNRANVDLMLETLNAAKQAGIKMFINMSSFHVFKSMTTPYTKSKRAVLEILEQENDIKVVNIFLPAVHGDDVSGKLGLVKKLPNFLRPIVFKFLTALMPTVHIEKVAEFVLQVPENAPRSVMLFDDQDKNMFYVAGKFAIDWLFALSVIFFAGWLLLLVWILVRIDSKGPGIFAQQRVGKHGISFVCYKFRTMKAGTRQAGTHELTTESITKIGLYLRKTKIDELPQVLNILKGQISLVGPRPGLPVQAELTAARAARGVFEVLPGITGLAQTLGVDMSDPERLAELDSRYIAQRGLIPDIGIIFATFLGRGQGDKIRT